MIALPPGKALIDLAGEAHLHDKDGGARSVRILLPMIWAGLPTQTTGMTYWPVVLDFEDRGERRTLDICCINRSLEGLTKPIRSGQAAKGFGDGPVFNLNAPLPEASVTTLADTQTRPPYTADPALLAKLGSGGKAAIVAVIDDGIPFAHSNFRDAAGTSTRVEFCWLQSADASADGRVLFGREYTRDDIDTLVGDHGPDEDAVYARAGAAENSWLRTASINHFASHGAHVLDAAAGRRGESEDVDLDLLRIIAVQLPAAITADTTGFRKDAFVISALHYIFDRADAVAAACFGTDTAPLPLVVNFSYGFTGGPHDGSDPLELAVAQLVAAREAQGKPTTLVMPSGNSFGEGMNGEITASALNTGIACPVPWRLQPNDHTSSYLEIWLPAAGDAASAPTFALAVAGPDGIPCETAIPLTVALAPVAGDTPPAPQDLRHHGVIVGQCLTGRYNDRWSRVLIALAPTEPDDPSLPAAPSGCWTISLTLTGGGPLASPVFCRIQRDNDPFGYSRGGRQSYFDDPLDQRFGQDGAPSRVENPPEALVRRFGTLNGIATHGHVTVVSGYYGDTGRATEYAAAGRRRPPGSPPGAGDVRLSAISDASTALRGVLAAGTRSGSAARLSGTSMAAPQVARALAVQSISSSPAPMQSIPVTYPIEPIELAERPIRLG
ncbi:hypothetical protein [Bosea sp. PAMC 26642]|uniref:hypothetical protein n=1 Tax=Bosea sp. (strain PAMC 26642) TaxID=1792307 RepID=UPI00077027ED|nr:hypothetical protein [Bosea sp. PAMC 26642]AMJ62446.1 hypothetical protein AXW83_20995 [Bosea sp. PAMC 26642]